MKNRVLVDATTWVEFFRAKPKISDSLAALLMENAVWTFGVVIFEVLQGIRTELKKSRALDILSILPYAETTRSPWEKSAELSLILKKNGVTLPNSDIFVAAIALGHGLSIFALDKHFSKIPGVNLFGI